MIKKTDYKLVVCLFAVAIVWGTTYLGIRIAVQTIPGWLVACFRQVVAMTVLATILFYRREFKWVGWKNCARHAFIASLMLVIANGMTTVAEETIPSGLTSLLTALTPIAVFVGSVIFGLQKLTLKAVFGVLIGFSGVVFIFRDGLSEIGNPDYLKGIFFLAIAILGWAIGSIYTKVRAIHSSNILLDVFYQSSFAAIVQFLISLFVYDNISASNWSVESMLAVVYLGVFGSVIGFVCYNYALKKVSPTEVSILSYINTVIAIFLGWLVLDETITFDFLIATALIILGVFITSYKKKSV